MSSPALEELENDVQKLIEEILGDKNWATAFGKVESPTNGGHESYLYTTERPVAAIETMERFLEIRGAVRKVLQHANQQSCAYNLKRGGKIEFDF